MRLTQLLLLLPLALFLIVGVFALNGSEPPTEEATVFLNTLRKNDIEAALFEFGDNTCHCAPEGGYISYLQYASGNNPNIAFLLGQNFSEGKATYEPLPYNGEQYVFPWDKPEDMLVRVPIQFDAVTSPYFIPLDSAYGFEISEDEMNKFLQHPEEGWKRAFTLRLRPSLKPGFIPARDPKAKKTEMERMAEDGTLPKEYLKYIHPKDAAGVKLKDGRTVPMQDYADRLPRLSSIVLDFKIVRRGSFKRWSVKKVGVEKPVLTTNGVSIEILEKDDSPANNVAIPTNK